MNCAKEKQIIKHLQVAEYVSVNACACDPYMFVSVMYGASAFVSLLYNRDDSKDDDNPQLVLFYTA